MEPSLEETLGRTGVIIHEVRGVSMLPMLDEKRDKVVIKSLPDKIKKYDLPLYKRPNGQYVLHRVIAVKKKYYLICGDNQFMAEKVPRDWLIGIADGYYKDNRYISCKDKDYQKYVRRRCRTRKLRYIRWRLVRARNKLWRILHHGKKR